MRDQQHTRTYYERQLRELKDRLLIMSSQAESMISDSIRSFVDRRPTLAAEVIERDDEMDRLEIEIDDLCYEILALEQPVACDLRFIATALKIVKDLERIGDIADAFQVLDDFQSRRNKSQIACNGLLERQDFVAKVIDLYLQPVHFIISLDNLCRQCGPAVHK